MKLQDLENIRACVIDVGINLPICDYFEVRLNEYGLDSIKLVFLVLKIEKKFNTEISQSDINRKNFESVRTIHKLISEKRKV